MHYKTSGAGQAAMMSSGRFNGKLHCVFVAALLFILIPFVSDASIPHKKLRGQTYVVKKGDTLYGISRKFDVEADKIRAANSLKSADLKTGSKLSIPGRSCSSKKQDAQYHTVKKGETLASISRKYSISIDELRELNGIKKQANLKRGRQLIVKKTGPKIHIVKKGDTISKIAKKYRLDGDELMVLNDLESDELKSGQSLLLEARTEEPASKAVIEAGFSRDLEELTKSQEVNSIDVKDRVILFARKMLNIPYRFGGSSFLGIDCSGYVQKVFGLLNMSLPRTAREQFTVGESVEKENLSMGDLVFFRTYASFPSHVGIYLGNNLFIHASSRSRKVSIDSLETPYYFKRFIGAKRLLEDGIKGEMEQEEAS